VKSKASEVDGLQSEFWFSFPDGYRQYVLKVGAGLLGGFVRIYSPDRIREELEEWRNRVKQFWLWDDNAKLLPKERAFECVVIGDTLHGDEIVFHPNKPKTIFVLPRGGGRIYRAGATLFEAIDWIFQSGKVVKKSSSRDFEPFNTPEELDEWDDDEDSDFIDERSFNKIIRQMNEVCAKYSWMKLAKQGFTSPYAIPRKQIKFTNTVSSFVFVDPEEGARFNFSFIVEDRKTKKEIGTYTWHVGPYSCGSELDHNRKNSKDFRRLYGDAEDY